MVRNAEAAAGILLKMDAKDHLGEVSKWPSIELFNRTEWETIRDALREYFERADEEMENVA